MVEAIRQGDIPGVQLRVRRELPADPERLWRWLTDPARLGRWLGEVVEREADALDLESGGGEAPPLRERLVIRERHAPRLWVLSLERLDAGWGAATRLTVEIVPRGAGCELSVFQQGFEHLSFSTCLTEWELYRRRWREALERLARALETAASG